MNKVSRHTDTDTSTCMKHTWQGRSREVVRKGRASQDLDLKEATIAADKEECDQY